MPMQRGQIAAMMSRRKKRGGLGGGPRPAPIPGRSGAPRGVGETIPANQRIPPPPSTVKEGAPLSGTGLGKKRRDRTLAGGKKLPTTGYGKPTPAAEPEKLVPWKIPGQTRGSAPRGSQANQDAGRSEGGRDYGRINKHVNRAEKEYLKRGGKQADIDAYHNADGGSDKADDDAKAYLKSNRSSGGRKGKGGTGALKKLKHVFKKLKKQMPLQHG